MSSELEKLKKLVSHCKDNVPFYSGLYSNLNINDIRSLDDFSRLVPVISKKQLLESVGTSDIDLGVDDVEEGAVFVRVTSGTSSKMACFYRTEKEIDISSERFFKSYSHYLNEDGTRDKVMIVSDFTLSYIFARHFARCGCVVCLGNPFDLNLTSQIIETIGCNVIRATPPVALRLAQVLSSRGYKNINKFFLAGSGLSSVGRTKLQEYYPDAMILMQYGMAEAALSLYQCKNILGTNTYHQFDEEFFYEIIDENSGKAVGTGGIGELVITKCTEDNPLVRYRTGDLFQVGDVCGCGKRDLKMLGRKDDHFKIKGIVVFKEKIDKAIYSARKYCTGEYQLFIDEIEEDNLPKAKLTLHIELDKKYSNSEEKTRQKIRDAIAKEFSDNFKITEEYSWSRGVELGIFSKVDVIIKERLEGIKIKSIVDKRYNN